MSSGTLPTPQEHHCVFGSTNMASGTPGAPMMLASIPGLGGLWFSQKLNTGHFVSDVFWVLLFILLLCFWGAIAGSTQS